MALPFIVLIYLLLPLHDVPTADFHLKLEPDYISVRGRFEAHDLLKAVEQETRNQPDDFEVLQYISESTAVAANKRKVQLSICDFQWFKGHFEFTGEFNLPTENLTSLTLHNQCLVQIPQHSNNYFVTVHDQVRGFRLHAERLSTTFDL